MSKQDSKVKTVNCTNSVMRTCVYSFSRGGELYGCDYIGKTGCRRGCPPSACDKYKKFEGKRPDGPKDDYKFTWID